LDQPWLAFYEAHVPRSIAYPEVPLFHLLGESARRFPERPALVFYGRVVTYGELEDLTGRYARLLLQLGIQRGERVAIMLPNSPQAVIGYYGALKAGAIVVMVNPLLVQRELEELLIDSGAKTILSLDLFYPRIAQARGRIAFKHILLTSLSDFLPWWKRPLFLLKAWREGQRVKVKREPPVYDFLQLLRSAKPQSSLPEISCGETALLQYTGGTTGTPKGVMLTHKNLAANTLQCKHWIGNLKEGQEVFLAVIPFFHAYGMSVCMNLAIATASSLVLLPRFHTEEALRMIERHRASIFPGVPLMYAAVNHHEKVKSFDLSSIKACISGAGPLHEEVQRRFEELTGGRLVEGYGLSEASPVTHCNPIYGGRKTGSIGLPYPDTEAKIVDPDQEGKEMAAGEIGELIVRGPQVMSGYWNRPAESAAVLRDGWLYTGDIAKMDEEGYFFIVDRKKDMIKTKGESVYPREIEEVLHRHPKVKEAAVVGVPDPFTGETVKAYIVVKDGEKATAEEIMDFCKGQLAAFKLPRSVEFRSELPRTAVGKVLRRTLLEEEKRKAQEKAA